VAVWWPTGQHAHLKACIVGGLVSRVVDVINASSSPHRRSSPAIYAMKLATVAAAVAVNVNVNLEGHENGVPVLGLGDVRAMTRSVRVQYIEKYWHGSLRSSNKSIDSGKTKPTYSIYALSPFSLNSTS